ncbi:hypothetical protein T484DRAFT_1932398 [Baffinella frigidus]|nr:hypothetical protein T484DRAFT_1932398 [Cryptophyta sp. CCMP2293]
MPPSTVNFTHTSLIIIPMASAPLPPKSEPAPVIMSPKRIIMTGCEAPVTPEAIIPRTMQKMSSQLA